MLSAVRILFDLAMMNSNLLSLGKLREIHFLCSTNWKKMENLHAHCRGIIVYTEYQSVCSFVERNWVSQPFPRKRVYPPWTQRVGATLACGWGVGGTHDWTESLALCILCEGGCFFRGAILGILYIIFLWFLFRSALLYSLYYSIILCIGISPYILVAFA
jgi:hypothetical protein